MAKRANLVLQIQNGKQASLKDYRVDYGYAGNKICLKATRLDGNEQKFEGTTFDRTGRKVPNLVKNASKGNVISIELSYEQAAGLVAQIVSLMQERISNLQDDVCDNGRTLSI